MNFTEKEIELAKKLKDDKIEWIVRTGDYVYDADDSETYLVIDGTDLSSIRLRNGERGIDKIVANIERLCWLPLLNQCVGIIQHQGMEVYLDSGDKD